VKGAGEGNALTIIVMMEKTSTYNYQIEFTSPELEDSQGVYFAISSDNFGIDAALKTQGQSVQPDQYATAGITRNQVDNRDLVNSWSYNLISEIDCLPTSTTKDINEDLRLGHISKDRYSKENCETTAKLELLAREILKCTYTMDTSINLDRCPKAICGILSIFLF